AFVVDRDTGSESVAAVGVGSSVAAADWSVDRRTELALRHAGPGAVRPATLACRHFAGVAVGAKQSGDPTAHLSRRVRHFAGASVDALEATVDHCGDFAVVTDGDHVAQRVQAAAVVTVRDHALRGRWRRTTDRGARGEVLTV